MANYFKNTISYLRAFRIVRNTKEQETVKRADINPILSELINFANNTQASLDSIDANTGGYTTFTYDVDGNLTNKTKYSDVTQTTIELTATYTYSSGNLITIVISDLISAISITKTLSYDINNNLTSINIT